VFDQVNDSPLEDIVVLREGRREGRRKGEKEGTME